MTSSSARRLEAPPRDSSAGVRRARFAGVELELLVDPSFRLELPLSHTHFVHQEAEDETQDAIRLTARVEVDAALEHDPRRGREIVVERGVATSRGVRVRFSEVGRRVVASARVAPGAMNTARLFDTLHAVAVEADGGILMHAAGVELDGRAYLFVGPSGAGKTTAAGQVFGGRSFCVDRVAVAFSGANVTAHAMPGGTDPIEGAARSLHESLPLAGVLRVVQAGDTAIETLDAHGALVALRESVFSAARDPDAEERRLERLLSLADRVAVVRLHNKLGAPLAGLLQGLARR